MKEYIVFTNNQQDFAVDISRIERIIEFENPKKVPEASDYLLGVIQYNSQVIPIIDLSTRLYNVKSNYDENTKIIVVMWKDKLIGLVIDEILGIQRFEKEQYEESGEGEILKKYISGFIKTEETIIIILNVDKIFIDAQEEELILATEKE